MKLYLTLFGFCVWVISCLLIYDNSRGKVEQQFIDSLGSKELDLTQLLDISFAYNISIKNQLETQLNLPMGSNAHPLTSRIKDYPEREAYGLSGQEVVNNQIYNANLTGIGSITDLDSRHLSEINSILHVDLSAPFTEKKHSFIWVYYQSKHGFILLSPAVGIQEFQLNWGHYDKPYWQIATPENNPERKTVISDLYDDGAGQGMMISISSPVYVGNTFKGVTAVDVGLSHLNQIINSGSQTLSKQVMVLTKEGVPVIGEQRAIFKRLTQELQNKHLPNHTFFTFEDELWLVSNLIKDKFYVVYELEKEEQFWLIVKRSALALLVLTLFIAIVLLLFALYEAFSQTKKLSEYDMLSRLYNRMTQEKLSDYLFNSEQKSRIPISILMADIDHFKQLNDTKGHHVGDEGIKQVAQIIKDNLRKTDIPGRFGGEEFIVTMPGTHQDKAFKVAERIRKAIESGISLDGAKLTISIGIAESSASDIYEHQALCKKADIALYKAKRDGRNRTVIYSEHAEEISRRQSR